MLLLTAFAMFAASFTMPQRKLTAAKQAMPADSLEPVGPSLVTAADSLALVDTFSLAVDTTQMDSLELAIYRHNKAIDDSLHLDSLNRQRKNGIDAPVEYVAEDSIIYYADSKTAYLFGQSNVKYQNYDLKSEKIYKISYIIIFI